MRANENSSWLQVNNWVSHQVGLLGQDRSRISETMSSTSSTYALWERGGGRVARGNQVKLSPLKWNWKYLQELPERRKGPYISPIPAGLLSFSWASHIILYQWDLCDPPLSLRDMTKTREHGKGRHHHWSGCREGEDTANIQQLLSCPSLETKPSWKSCWACPLAMEWKLLLW